MQDNPSDIRPPSPQFTLLRVPLFRLLAINLAIGACAAALLVAGCCCSIPAACAT